jgi:ABC-type antimicrobial peptide transport system permease subunit
VVAYDLRGAGYSPVAAAVFQRRVAERLTSLPGVRAVAETTAVPLSDQHAETSFGIGGDRRRYLEFSQVSASYFQLLGIPIVRGRTFLPSEMDSQRAAIVTESTARRLWPGADPLAQTLMLDTEARPIVGVVRDSQVSRLGSSTSDYVFLPIGSSEVAASRSAAGAVTDNAHILVAASAGRPTLRDLAAIVRGLDPELAVDVSPLAANLEQWRAPSVVVSSLSSAIALLAIVLACTGVFGTVAYTVSRRVREIGIRVTLGANRRDVLRLIVGQGMRPVIAGLAIGTLAAFAATTLLEKMLFGLSPHDPWSFVLTPAALAVIAVAACYVPARRALRVDPTIALRAE